jgi:hypothetical protein
MCSHVREKLDAKLGVCDLRLRASSSALLGVVDDRQDDKNKHESDVKLRT